MSTLPASSLTEHQNEIMYPAGVYEKLPIDDSDKEMMEQVKPRKEPDEDFDMKIYSSQIWMRVILNEAHNALYGASKFANTNTTAFSKANMDQVAARALILPTSEKLPPMQPLTLIFSKVGDESCHQSWLGKMRTPLQLILTLLVYAPSITEAFT